MGIVYLYICLPLGTISLKPFDGLFKIISLYDNEADVKNTSKPRN